MENRSDLNSPRLSDLLHRLVNIGVFKLGEFTLKSGVISPVYVDLRSIISHPNLVQEISQEVRYKQEEKGILADVICGVPYTALPIASVFSVLHKVPMVMKRKEAKSYGTKKMVEGVVKKDMTCLIVEDIVSSGSSVIETAEVFRKEGLVITDCIVVLDRLQGGEKNLTAVGIRLHALFNIYDLFNTFCAINKVEAEVIDQVQLYFRDNNYIPIKKMHLEPAISYKQRSKNCVQPVAKQLFEIIDAKKSNLCVAVDTTSSVKLLKLAKELGPHICMLKTHIDILSDFNEEVVQQLSILAKEYSFLLFEDRKFADIGNTVINQYKDGLYKIQTWADIVTVHGIPGSSIIRALKSAAGDSNKACVLIAEMSSEGALTDDYYVEKIIEMAEIHPDFVIGCISQRKLSKKENFIHMCPGVNLKCSGDTYGQQYNSPEYAVRNGADVIIVGRGICEASDIIETAIEYKTKGYNAYVRNVDL